MPYSSHSSVQEVGNPIAGIRYHWRLLCGVESKLLAPETVDVDGAGWNNEAYRSGSRRSRRFLRSLNGFGPAQ